VILLQVFGLDRRLRASIYLGVELSAVAFLNDSGDLLVAPAGPGAAAAAAGPAGAAGALLLVRADSYAGGLVEACVWCMLLMLLITACVGCVSCAQTAMHVVVDGRLLLLVGRVRGRIIYQHASKCCVTCRVIICPCVAVSCGCRVQSNCAGGPIYVMLPCLAWTSCLVG
jgi:hypothetical protein